MNSHRHLHRLACLAALVALAGVPLPSRAAAPVAGEEPDEYAAPKVSDPLEKMNRALFKFNDGFYAHVLRPLARGYKRVVPAPVRRGLGNFFDNLKFPVRFAGSILQARPGRAARETGKFVLNTTVGLAGLVRVSDDVPALVDVPPEDVGQAIGAWGVGSGPFLVLPFLGPSSLRDTVGLVGNTLLNPVNWTATENTFPGYNAAWTYRAQAIDFTNATPGLVETYDGFKQSSVDPYTAVRDGYLQYRAAAVKK